MSSTCHISSSRMSAWSSMINTFCMNLCSANFISTTPDEMTHYAEHAAACQARTCGRSQRQKSGRETNGCEERMADSFFRDLLQISDNDRDQHFRMQILFRHPQNLLAIDIPDQIRIAVWIIEPELEVLHLSEKTRHLAVGVE